MYLFGELGEEKEWPYLLSGLLSAYYLKKESEVSGEEELIVPRTGRRFVKKKDKTP